MKMNERLQGFYSLRSWLLLAVMVAAWNVALVCIVWRILRRPQGSFPFQDRQGFQRLTAGLLVGIVVMGGCILAIIAMGNANVTVHPQSIFGSAGSGYLNQGHLLDFVPSGSDFVTGGEVGPEGSVFAFVAVVAAFSLLMATTRRRIKP